MIVNTFHLWSTGWVRRWHTRHTVTEQNLGQHQWGCLQLLLEMFPDSSRELIIFVSRHDVQEEALSDVARPSYMLMPGVKDLMDIAEAKYWLDANKRLATPMPTITEEEHWRWKVVDLMEAIFFIRYEMMKGNQLMGQFMQDCVNGMFALYEKQGINKKEVVEIMNRLGLDIQVEFPEGSPKDAEIVGAAPSNGPTDKDTVQ